MSEIPYRSQRHTSFTPSMNRRDIRRRCKGSGGMYCSIKWRLTSNISGVAHAFKDADSEKRSEQTFPYQKIGRIVLEGFQHSRYALDK